MNILESVTKYFTNKTNNTATTEAPEGICPNCWGKQEWEGEFYKKIKANNITQESNIYSNFISDVVKKLDKITLKEDSYTCETCKVSYNK